MFKFIKRYRRYQDAKMVWNRMKGACRHFSKKEGIRCGRGNEGLTAEAIKIGCNHSDNITGKCEILHCPIINTR